MTLNRALTMTKDPSKAAREKFYAGRTMNGEPSEPSKNKPTWKCELASRKASK